MRREVSALSCTTRVRLLMRFRRFHRQPLFARSPADGSCDAAPGEFPGLIASLYTRLFSPSTRIALPYCMYLTVL